MLQMFCWTFWPNTSPVPPHQLAFDTPADTVRETFGRNSVLPLGTGIRFSSSPSKHLKDRSGLHMRQIFGGYLEFHDNVLIMVTLYKS